MGGEHAALASVPPPEEENVRRPTSPGSDPTVCSVFPILILVSLQEECPVTISWIRVPSAKPARSSHREEARAAL